MVFVATGCGVPDSGEPVPLDDAPGIGGPAAPEEKVTLPGPGRDSTADLVKKFLQVGAAADFTPDLDKDERIPAAEKYARSFLSQIGNDTWKPSKSVDVIAVTSMQITSPETVIVTARRVGTLEGDGSLRPGGTAGSESYEFRSAPSTSNGPRLLEAAPSNLLPLSLDGLQSLFEVRPVYFWSQTTESLIPDRRYLSKGISPAKRVNTIVDRVLAEPSDFLADAVIEPPAKATTGNAVLNGNNVVVYLPVTPKTDQEKPLRQLASQIRWSLHPDRYSVELQVGRRQHVYSGNDYLADNWSLPRTRRNSNDERLYGSVDGKVTALDPLADAPSILDRPENANVVAAAINTRQNSAALVRAIGTGKQLWVGRTPADQTPQQFRVATFPPVTTFSRPSYLPGARERVLIVADGALYDVDLGSGVPTRVDLPAAIGPLVSIAVAPDGARIAFVTASKVYVALIDSSKSPAVIRADSQQSIQEIYVGQRQNLRAVGWYYEHELVVGDRSALVVAAIDGGSLRTIGAENLLGTELTQLSAVPWDPILNNAGNLVIETRAPQNGPLQVFTPYMSGMGEAIQPPSSASPSPSGSPSGPGGAKPPAPKLTAAFYADVI